MAHQLHGVVARRGDAGQDLFRELIVRADFFFFLRHADVAFVNIQRIDFALFVAAIRPGERLGRGPDLARKGVGPFILHSAENIGRNALGRACHPG